MRPNFSGIRPNENLVKRIIYASIDQISPISRMITDLWLVKFRKKVPKNPKGIQPPKATPSPIHKSYPKSN